MKKRSTFVAISLVFLLGIALPVVLPSTTSTARAAPSADRSKPLHFYFHYLEKPVSVAGMQTHYVMNTTQWFRFLTQKEAYDHSLYKPIGLPRIVVDYYLYPNLAGPVTIDGTWQVFIWINGSAFKPCGFNVQFREISVGGETLWDSGVLTPTVTSDIGSYIDVPVYNYNLSVTSLAHTFSADATLQVEVTINPGAAAECRVWYDSPLYPSKVILPCQDYARPISVKTFDVNLAETNLFSPEWERDQRKVIVHANVTDPFGGYDIYMVKATILDPSNQTVLDGVNMTRISNGMWILNYLHTYEATWSYPETAMLGNYTAEISVIDNNGYYHYLDYGLFDPYIEQAYHIFNIGIIVLHNPAFRVVDDADSPLPQAQVYVRLPNGTANTLPLYTSDNGFINLTQVPTGNCGFTIMWKGVIVQQTNIYVDSDGPYTIKCRVYQVPVQILGSDGAPIHGAYVVIYTQVGLVYDFKITDASGQAVFKLPVGTYNFRVWWQGVIVQEVTHRVDSSGPYAIPCEVYKLTFKVLGNNGGLIQGAHVIVFSQDGMLYDFKITDASGVGVSRLPIGTYRVDVFYTTEYWLTHVAVSATKPSVYVASSTEETIILTDYPPPLWTTIGFWLVVAPFAMVCLGLVFLIKRKRILGSILP